MKTASAKTSARRSDHEMSGRIAAFDWDGIALDLDANGAAIVRCLLSAGECNDCSGLYDNEALFRSTVVMARHGFGRGEYRYFDYPLPDLVQALRRSLYPRLAPIANRWRKRLGGDASFPLEHEVYLKHCHPAGQTRPTPLLLRYREGDYNCLHQDLYGEHVFPLQVAMLLAEPGRFEGGEFVLTEQRPRMQSRVEVVPLRKGDAVIFPVRERPVQGSKGVYRVNMRHGVSRVRGGLRHTLGIIFHDAA
jgi:uncharacterized protein